MQVSVSKGKDLSVNLNIKLPNEKIEASLKTRLEKMGRTAKMDGFRPGKVPLSVLKKRYGRQIRAEVLDEAMRQGFYDAVVQENLKPAGVPAFEIKVDKPGEDLVFDATFEVIPEVSLPKLSGIKLEKPIAEVTEQNIDQEQEKLLKHFAKWEPVDRAAEEGDQVICEYSGQANGQQFGSEADKPLTILIGQPAIFDLHDSLKGAKAGEVRELTVTLPENFQDPNLAGQSAALQVTVQHVTAEQLPELNEAFFESVQCKDLADLRQKITEALQQNLERATQDHLKLQLFENLLKLSKFKVPQATIREEIEHRKQQFAQSLQQYGTSQQVPELPDDMFEQEATRQVKLSFLSSAAIKEFDLKLDQEKLQERLQSIVSTYPQPDEMMQALQRDKQRMQQVQSMVLEEQIVDALLEQVKIKERKSDFDTVMADLQKQAHQQ